MTWTLKKISPLLGNRVLGGVFICESFATGGGFFLSVENCITFRLVGKFVGFSNQLFWGLEGCFGLGSFVWLVVLFTP